MFYGNASPEHVSGHSYPPGRGGLLIFGTKRVHTDAKVSTELRNDCSANGDFGMFSFCPLVPRNLVCA